MESELKSECKIPKNIENFEHVYYINLEHRGDRKTHVENEFVNIGIKGAKRFNATKMVNGAIGCTMSHIKLLQYAKQNGLPYIMICEDDIQFTNPQLFKDQINGLLQSDETWDVILVAGNNLPPYSKINDFCVKVRHCQTTTGYIIKSDYFDTLLENMKEGVKKLIQEPHRHFLYAVDKYWISLQEKGKWLLITPLTVVQRVDYSDIERRITNYRKVMTDLDKESFLRMVNNARPL